MNSTEEPSQIIAPTPKKRLFWVSVPLLIITLAALVLGYSIVTNRRTTNQPIATQDTTPSPSLSPTQSPSQTKTATLVTGYAISESTDKETVFSQVDFQGIKTEILRVPKNDKDTRLEATISPDGTILVYTDTNFNLQRYDIPTKKTTLLKASVRGEENVGQNIAYTDVVFSPDSKMLGIDLGGWEWSGTALMNADGTNFQRIESGCGVQDFAWAPDSKQFVLGAQRSDLGGEPACLYVANTTEPNKGKQILVKNTGSELDHYKDVYAPQWSPDGSKIAFGYRYLDYGKDRENAGKAEKYRGIYVVNADGTNFKQVTDNRSFSDKPFWKDASTIIYGLSNETAGTNKGIFSITATGETNTELFSAGFTSFDLLTLSPDNRHLIYRAGNKKEYYDQLTETFLLELNTKKTVFLGNKVEFVGWLTN